MNHTNHLNIAFDHFITCACWLYCELFGSPLSVRLKEAWRVRNETQCKRNERNYFINVFDVEANQKRFKIILKKENFFAMNKKSEIVITFEELYSAPSSWRNRQKCLRSTKEWRNLRQFQCFLLRQKAKETILYFYSRDC